MKRKILCLLLLIPFLFGSFTMSEDSTGFDPEVIAEDYFIVVSPEHPETAVLGLERNADERCYPASTTKVLTCIIALEEAKLSKKIKVPSSADSDRVSGSVMGIHKKEVYTLEDLLYGLMLPSGNDAAIAIAVGLYGSVEAFADRMNGKAIEIGMLHSHFVTPNGLHDDDHYSTARDLAILSCYAMQNKTFREIVGTAQRTIESDSGRKIKLRSSNRFLRDYLSTAFEPESVLYPEAIGIKTGETNAAGKCLIAAAKRRETEYIAVLLHGEMPPDHLTPKEKDPYSVRRYYDARTLLEYAFEQDIRTVTVQELLSCCLPDSVVRFYDADSDGILSAYYRIEWNGSDSYSAPLYLFEKEFFSDPFPSEYVEYSWDDKAPAIGAVAGTATIRINGIPYFSAPIRCEEIERPTPVPTLLPTVVPTASPAFDPANTPAPKRGLLSCAPNDQP